MKINNETTKVLRSKGNVLARCICGFGFNRVVVSWQAMLQFRFNFETITTWLHQCNSGLQFRFVKAIPIKEKVQLTSFKSQSVNIKN